MNKKINLDINALKIIFGRNKLFLALIVIILISVFLFFQFLIPQIKALVTASAEAKNESLRIKTLQQNLNILENTQEASLNQQLSVLSLALPTEKDFGAVLNTIYYISQKTGVGLGDFSFKVGDVSKGNSDKSSKITLTLPVNSNIVGVNSFIQFLNNTVPLSDVTFVKLGRGSSSINVEFYFNPIDAYSYDNQAPIAPISQRGVDLVTKLNAFSNISSSEVSSGSAR